MLKRGIKRHLFSGIFAILVISMLLLSGPANAIQVSLITPDINVNTDTIKQITVKVDVDDGEFLPVISTDIDFTANSQTTTCSLDSNNVLTGCDFLSFVSRDIVDLVPGFGYGYDNSLGYFGYGYSSGFGYGYGAPSTGSIIYTFNVNASLLPEYFIGQSVNVLAEVKGGTEGNEQVFTGSSSFQVNGVTDSFLVGNARDELTFGLIKASNVLESQITGNLNLPGITTDGVTISWASSNSNRINPFNGVVSRPEFTESDHTVTLTATLSKGSVTTTKAFTLIVLKHSKTDTQSVLDAINAINFATFQGLNTATNNILSDLSLNTSNSENVVISWSSDKSNVITSKGSVARQSLDQTVVLTATAKKGSVTQTASFTLVVKGTTDLDELAVNNAKSALTENLVLNGNAARENIINSIKLPGSLTGHSGVGVSWSSSDSSIIALNGTLIRDNNQDKSVTLTATLSKNGKTTTKAFGLVVKKNVAPAVVTSGKKTELNVGQTEVKIDSTNKAAINEIKIPMSVAQNVAVVLNLQSLVDQTTKKLTLTDDKLVLTRESSTQTIVVDVPQGTVIDGGSDWNGLIQAPTIEETVEAENFSSGTPQVIMSVGVPGVKLILSKATKITLPGAAGKSAGFTEVDGTFQFIATCTSSEVSDPNTLPDGGDCRVDAGSDLTIWTKHFTQFFSYLATPESCNGADDNGDGQVDEGVTTTFYEDTDDDGYGDPNNTQDACSAPSGFVSNDDDCDDGNEDINPGETESYDSVDNDCDSQVDEGFTPTTEICDGTDNDLDGQIDENVKITFYIDSDSDGYGVSSTTTLACSVPSGYASNTLDCNNANSAIKPGVSEICDSIDNDCDGQVDEGNVCAPTTPTTPEPETLNGESCDGVDNDLDGLIDESYDDDNDGFTSCGTKVDGSDVIVDNVNRDCQPFNGGIYPGASEMCNGADENCNNLFDESFDSDNDGYTTCGTKTDGSDKSVNNVGLDCNDNNKNINPGVKEICNLVDDNCNAQTDEGVQKTFYNDKDKDGKGNANDSILACTLPVGYTTNKDDCSDNDANDVDLDQDGLLDCHDLYIDDDHLSNMYDPILGQLKDIKTNFPGIDLTLDGISLIKAEASLKTAIISGGRDLIITFMNGVTKPVLDVKVDLVPEMSPLNLFTLNVFTQEKDSRLGSLYVNGLKPAAVEGMTAYVDRLKSYRTEVCATDNVNLKSINGLSEFCTDAGESVLDCSAGESKNGIKCVINNGRYKVSGFQNAVAVREMIVKVQADYDGSECVDFPDFVAFAKSFNTETNNTNYFNGADFDSNGRVEFMDFVQFAKRYNTGVGCGGSAPKPITLPI